MRTTRLPIAPLALLAACAAPAAQVDTTVVRPEAPHSTSRSAPLNVEGEMLLSGSFLAPMPVAVTSFGADSDDTYAYVLGGYHGTPHHYTREGQSAALMRLPLDGSGGWEVIGEMANGAQGLAAVVHDGALCRFGGNEIHNVEGETEAMESVATAECFDLETRSFKALPAMPAGRSSHEADMIGDTAYVAGGWQLAGTAADSHFHDTVLAIDLSAAEPTWRSIAAPFQRRAVGVAAAGGKLFIVGGLEPDGEMSRRTDIYDPSTGAFTQGPDYPVDAFGVSVEGVGDKIYASARDGVLYSLSSAGGAWEPVADLAFGRFFHQLVGAGDGGLVAIGGISGMHNAGRTRPVERIALNASAPNVGVLDLPYPGQAKNRQGAFVEGDYLYLFGGNNSLGQHDFEPNNFLDEGLRVHLPSFTWERVASYPARRQTISVVGTGDEALFVGGFGHDGENAVSSPEAFAYDLEDDEFEPRAGLPESRTQFGLAQHGDELFVFGGLNYDPTREGEAAFAHVTEVLSAPADLSTPFAPTGASLPGPRRAFAGATLGDRYYMFGGMKGGFALVDDCSAFDFSTKAFVSVACPSAPRLSADLVALDGKLYLVGGSTVNGEEVTPANTIEVFDPATGAWSTVVEELPFDSRHMRAFAYGGRLLLVSMHNEEGRFRAALIDPVVR